MQLGLLGAAAPGRSLMQDEWTRGSQHGQFSASLQDHLEEHSRFVLTAGTVHTAFWFRDPASSDTSASPADSSSTCARERRTQVTRPTRSSNSGGRSAFLRTISAK